MEVQDSLIVLILRFLDLGLSLFNLLLLPLKSFLLPRFAFSFLFITSYSTLPRNTLGHKVLQILHVPKEPFFFLIFPFIPLNMEGIIFFSNMVRIISTNEDRVSLLRHCGK